MLERIHLIIIREIERVGTLTKAAKRLSLTQSALSHAIKKMEQRLGGYLWQRKGRKLQLTQAGNYLLGIANRLLPQLEQAEEVLSQFALGQHGNLRIGMECHPCYRWLLKIVSPFLQRWPAVDIDVKQKFQFGGVGALFSHEIDILVTPDPLLKRGLRYEPVFHYEQVLVVSKQHPLASHTYVIPEQLVHETLITYPFQIERLDIYNQFFLPASRAPKKHKVIETTDILLQMVASGRGVTALPQWLVEEYTDRLPLCSIRLGPHGIDKQIFLGMRVNDIEIEYIKAFTELAKHSMRNINKI